VIATLLAPRWLTLAQPGARRARASARRRRRSFGPRGKGVLAADEKERATARAGGRPAGPGAGAAGRPRSASYTAGRAARIFYFLANFSEKEKRFRCASARAGARRGCSTP